MENSEEKPLWKILREFLRKFIDFVCDVLRELNRHAKFHGISHIVNTRLHPLERVLWLLLVSISLYIIFRIGYSQVTRFIEKPTVISIDRSKIENIFGDFSDTYIFDSMQTIVVGTEQFQP